MRYVFFLSASLSLALHAAVLLMRISPVAPKEAANGASDTAPPFLRVRTIPMPASSPPSRLPLSARESLQLPERVLDSAPASPAEAPRPAPPSLMSVKVDSDSYIPRNQLTTPPIARSAIVLKPPSGEVGAGRLVGVLSLFIDEQGRVIRVDAEEPALPPLFEQAARETFLTAEFSPGEVDGQAVRSRLRVEVVFDYTP